MDFNFTFGSTSEPQGSSDDDDFNLVGGEIYASSSPWASWLGVGNPFAPQAMPVLATPAGSAATQGDPGSIVAVTSGGITINLIFDAAALAAPASFRAGIQQAVAILAAAISDKITVNIKIDYSGTGGGAAAGPDHGLFESYSSIRANLINNATSGDTTFNALAAGSSIQGQSNVAVWNAQLKLWGLMNPNDTTTDDGGATFATDINPNLLVGVALHELTHAMGRVPYGPQPDIFDLFRFSSAGTRLFQGGATAPAAYFSLDGGNTKVADYGRNSDASDFLNSGVQGPNDPFNEFYNGATSQQLTATDLKQLDALGFHLTVPDTQAPILLIDNPLSVQTGATQPITFTLLNSTDNVSSAAQLRYTVATGPAHGILLLSGVATSSFTQADINNGVVSYHETASGVASDTFSFQLSDAAGNTSGIASFQINISDPNHAPTDETLSGGVIAENSPNGTVAGLVTGIDPDAGTLFTYSLLDNAAGRFSIDAHTGQLTVADGSRLDFQAASSYNIIVHAADQGGLSIDKAFAIQILDVPATAQFGTSGNDFFSGTAGADTMLGAGGNDIFIVDNPGDHVIETAGGGNDTVSTGVSYALDAGQEIETLETYTTFGTVAINLTGNEFANKIVGNDGANFINGGGGADTMYGFGGNDIFIVDNAGDHVFESIGGGNDTVSTGVSYVLDAGQEIENLETYSTAGTAAINLTGNEFNNRIVGNDGANFINGGGGADTMIGLGGNDIFIVDNAGDHVIEAAGGGNDNVSTSVSYSLEPGQEIENLETPTTSGTAAINLAGNEFANRIVGNNGDNLISGGAGNDTLLGFGGHDTFVFNTALNATTNVDTIADFDVANDTILLNRGIFTALAHTGALDAAAFFTGTAAHDADDRIVYNDATGALSYDADGNGAAAAVQFATLTAHLSLTNAHFVVT